MLAAIGRLLIVDFPNKVHEARRPFLEPAQVKVIQNKLDRDRYDAEYDTLIWSKFGTAYARWDLWFL